MHCHSCSRRVRIVSVLDQFKHGQTRTPDQLIAKKLKQPGTRAEYRFLCCLLAPTRWSDVLPFVMSPILRPPVSVTAQTYIRKDARVQL